MEFPRIFPSFAKPRRLEAYRAADVAPESRLALKSLQGLVNAEQPRIYEITAPCDEHWLRYYQEKYGIEYSFVGQTSDLFQRYASLAKGLVVYDDAVPDTKNLAVTLAGLDGLLPASPGIVSELESYGLGVESDLRGRFSDRLSVYRWGKDELLPRCNGRILGSLCVGRRKYWIQNRVALVDYLVANRSFVFHLSAARRDREENQLFDEILGASKSPGVVMGWHCARDQEKEYVSRAARKGFFVLCSASSPNLTVHGGIPRARDRYSQREPKALEGIESKVYLTLYLTDGDANWAMNSLQSDNWASEKRGTIPFNWGLLPLMYDMSPGFLEYYYETAGPNDYFACPSSGAAYTYSFLHDDWYLHYSKRYLDLSGQRVVNMVNWDTNLWWREVEDNEAICREKAILKPTGMVCGLGGSVYATSYPLGTPKVHASVILNEGEDCAAKVLDIARAIPERPLFLFAFVQIRAGVYDHLAENLKSLPPEIEILPMDTFMESLKAAARSGLIGADLYPSRSNFAQSLSQEGKLDKESAQRLMARLLKVSRLPEADMSRELNLGNWNNLAAKGPRVVEKDFDKWRETHEGFLPYDTLSLPDALGYYLFYTTWAYVRGCLNAAGRYANHMEDCLDQYMDLFPDPSNDVLEDVWEMWRKWETDPPELAQVKELTERASALVAKG